MRDPLRKLQSRHYRFYFRGWSEHQVRVFADTVLMLFAGLFLFLMLQSWQ